MSYFLDKNNILYVIKEIKTNRCTSQSALDKENMKASEVPSHIPLPSTQVPTIPKVASIIPFLFTKLGVSN